jgi:putative transposase
MSMLGQLNMSLSGGVKFGAYPTEKQREVLSQLIGCQRLVYNAKAAEDHYFCTFRHHSLSLTGMLTPVNQQCSQSKHKQLTPFLYDVPSQLLRNDAVRFMGGHTSFLDFVG